MCFSAYRFVFPRLNAQYRIRGMHESRASAQFEEPSTAFAVLFCFTQWVRRMTYSLRASPHLRWYFVHAPSMTECSRSNLHSLACKQAYRLASLEYQLNSHALYHNLALDDKPRKKTVMIGSVHLTVFFYFLE